MPVLSSPGLALLGSCDLAAHLAAIRVRALHLVGHWAEDPVETGSPVFIHPSEALSHPETQGVVVCTPLHSREHWVRQALRAGKPVLCASPPANTFRRLAQLAAEADLAGAPVLLISRLRPHTDWRSLPSAGALYFSLRGDIPRESLKGTREGVLLHWAAEVLQQLADRFGPLDSVYARTRSLGLNRPEEDQASALLRFRNGVEGIVSFVGLGDDTAVELREWDASGTRTFRASWGPVSPQLLEPHYQDFATLLSTGQVPANDLRERLEGFRWAEWIQQSARLDREIHAKEVVHE